MAAIIQTTFSKYEACCILTNTLTSGLEDPVTNNPQLDQMMSCSWITDKPLYKQAITLFTDDIYITGPLSQYVNWGVRSTLQSFINVYEKEYCDAQIANTMFKTWKQIVANIERTPPL